MERGKGLRVSSQLGFSLIEALVAISLAGILSAIGVPVVSSYASQYRLVGTAKQLAFDIARARMQAVGQNVFVRIRFVDGGYVRERSTDNGATFTQDGGITKLPSGITISADTPIFNKNGLATAVTVITLTSKTGSKTVRTNMVGRVTVS